jgi:hypothetical protein
VQRVNSNKLARYMFDRKIMCVGKYGNLGLILRNNKIIRFYDKKNSTAVRVGIDITLQSHCMEMKAAERKKLAGR